MTVRQGWRLFAGGTFLRKDLRFTSGATDATSIPNLGSDPGHQFTLRSSHDLPGNTELDVSLRRIGRLTQPVVAAYTAVDARLARQFTPHWNVALLGQNLFKARHVEFDPVDMTSQIERRVLLQVTWTP